MMDRAGDVKKGVFETLLHARNRIDSAIDLFGWQTEPATSPLNTDTLLRHAERMIQERENRSQHFPTMPLGEPVWDLLLDLFVSHVRCRQISITSACIATNAPPTTALRYIIYRLFCRVQFGRNTSNDGDFLSGFNAGF
jgi:hypothetical protein